MPLNRSTIIRATIGLITLVLITEGGKWIQTSLHLRLPGPVIGLSWLAVAIVLMKPISRRASHQVSLTLEPISRALLKYMGLLFVPAGVGVITQLDVIRREWVAITVALVGSTVLGVAATGWVAQRFSGGHHSADPS